LPFLPVGGGRLGLGTPPWERRGIFGEVAVPRGWPDVMNESFTSSDDRKESFMAGVRLGWLTLS
jgi:hypothetical protein